jgi:cytoskeleton protein RodZ
MPSVAEQLLAAREAQHLTVHQLADKTKIKTEHIRALESGDYNAFTAPVYIRGFVRTCCRTLRIEEGPVMVQLDSELAATQRFSVPPSLSPKGGGIVDAVLFYLSRMKWGVVLPLLGGALLLVGVVWGYRAWRDYQARDPLAGLGPGQYQPGRNLTGETLAVPRPAGTNR